MKINNFVVQASISLKDYKKVTPKQRIKNYRTMYSELFGSSGLRIAFKLHSAYDVDTEFELPHEIETYLKEIYYTVNPDNTRQAMYKTANKYSDITKILAKQKDAKAKELLIMFNRENQKFLKDNTVAVWCILSRYARDYLGQAYDKSWDSCKNFKDGVSKNYLQQELISGYLCAYFIRTNLDIKGLVHNSSRSAEKQILTLIDKSLGRMLLVPYRYGAVVAGKPDANTVLIPAQLVYGFVPVSAKTELRNYLDQNYNEKVYKVEKAVKVFVAPGYPDSNPVQNYYGATKENIGQSSLEERSEMVSADHEKINLIEDPKERLALVSKFPESIQYIKKPSEELQIASVSVYGGIAIRLIKNPTEKVKLLSVEAQGRNLKFIPQATDVLKLAAVKQNGFALRYISNPTEEMILLALTQNGAALQFIENPTAKMTALAKKTSGAIVTKLKKIKCPCYNDTYGEDIRS
jgi:hypothetical protein